MEDTNNEINIVTFVEPLTQDYATEIYGTSSNGSTKVTIYFSYEKTPLSNSPARTEIKKAKQPITSEMTPAIK